MASEAIVIELLGENAAGEQLRFTCASGTAIPQGTLLALSASPRTVSASTTTGQVFVGVASMDKSATDNSTEISAWTNGVFSFAASGTINDGDQVITAASSGNHVMASNSISSAPFAKLVGIAVDDASGGRVAVRINR